MSVLCLLFSAYLFEWVRWQEIALVAFLRESTQVRESAQICCNAVLHQHQQVRSRITTSHTTSRYMHVR